MNEKGELMSNNAKIAADLWSFLRLSLPPIAVSFPDVEPDNVPHYDGVVPAGCSFWQQAANGTFVTSAQDHALCSIGVHTHHMADPAPSHQTELADALQAMSGLDYVRAEEIAAIPVITREVKHVVYGRLAEFPLDPEVVLLFTHAQQGLIISEAVARVDKDTPPGMGRPACAVIPRVLNDGSVAMSLGCCGARAYLDALSDDIAMWAFPGNKLEEYC